VDFCREEGIPAGIKPKIHVNCISKFTGRMKKYGGISNSCV
jgi:hypothetical protein